jgi:hypothetical protein
MSDDEAQMVLLPNEGQRVGGRPMLLTDEMRAKIVRNVRRCGKMSIAAQACGIHAKTLARWMKLGLMGHEPFVQLCKDVELARGEWAMERVDRIASAEEWQANAWLLERMNGDSYDRPKLVVDLQRLPEMPMNQLEELVTRVFGQTPNALPADVASDAGNLEGVGGDDG